MATKVICRYAGDMQTEIEQLNNGKKIATDLPSDNGGKGRTFSPTDLLTASLSSCILTIMAKLTARDNINFENTELELEKIMQDKPRRVAAFIGKLKLPKGLTEDQKKKLINCIETCPVSKSLHPDIKINIEVV